MFICSLSTLLQKDWGGAKKKLFSIKVQNENMDIRGENTTRVEVSTKNAVNYWSQRANKVLASEQPK